MITREQIHELAKFEDQASCALSFYFQPTPPRNKAHKEEAILTKDLVREAVRQLEDKRNEDKRNGSKHEYEAALADLDRVMRLSEELRGNGVHAKAVFACSAQGFWREYDLPAQLSGTELSMDRHFRVKPLAQLLGAVPMLGVVLLDRHRARLFDLRLGEISERMDFFHPLTRRGRSDGFMGLDAGHAERHVEDEVREHFKGVAAVIKNALEKGLFEKWILGCQDIHWPQFEPQLHPYASQKLLGRFNPEVGYMSNEEIRSHAEKIFAGAQDRRRRELVREAIEQAGHNNLGATGLRRVLFSLELGEVQTLLIGQNYRAQAVECSNCGHLDAHLVSSCPVCGHSTSPVLDVVEAMMPRVIQNNIEVFFLRDNPELDKVGNIAALLRYRSEQNHNMTARSVADVPPNPSLSRRTGLVGRYRGLASG
jgi:peptide subunit release factor 1 (eRF1)